MKRIAGLVLAFVWASALVVMPVAPAFAQERILGYDSQVQVNRDGSLDVREQIKVRAEGTNIRRGIYRDFPTRYTDRQGNRVVVDLHVIDVLRDGKAEPWFTERLANGVRINTGNDELLPLPGEFTYTVHYRTTRQLGFFADHDELYWNAIGTGWDFPIESGSVDVRLPTPVPVDQLAAEGYTGERDSKGQNYTASVPAPGQAHWQLTLPLAPHEGLTVVLSFPKGVVVAPSREQRIWWLLKDNRGGLIALAGLVLMLLFCFRRWSAIGRDPRPGVVIARYDPPPGYSPAALRFIQRMGHDNRAFSADVLSLAVAGFLRIERDKGLLKDEWSLTRTRSDGLDSLPDSQRALHAKLFAAGGTLVLKNTNASIMQAAQAGHRKMLDAAYDRKMFKRNGGSIAWAVAILAVTGVAAFVLGGGTGVLMIIPILILMAITLGVFAWLVRAPTLEGRRMLDEIEGLKRYLSVAERDELASVPGPHGEETRPPMLDAKRYEFLLPYAVALDVEDAWTSKFTLAVGAAAAAAATAGIAWYRGGGIDSMGSLSKAVGNSLSSQIASSSTPPGSSSGAGGGGFSGGGGGGGGGGGR